MILRVITMISLQRLIREYVFADIFVERDHSSTRNYECKCGRTIQRYSIRDHLRTLNHREWWRANHSQYSMSMVCDIERDIEQIESRRVITHYENNNQQNEYDSEIKENKQEDDWNEIRNHNRQYINAEYYTRKYELVTISELDQNSPSTIIKPQTDECGICYEKKTIFLSCKVCKNIHCEMCGIHIQKCPFCRSDFGLSIQDKIFIYKINYYWNFFKNEPNQDTKCMSLYALCRVMHKYKDVFMQPKYNTCREILRLTLIEEFHSGFESGVFFISLLGLNNRF